MNETCRCEHTRCLVRPFGNDVQAPRRVCAEKQRGEGDNGPIERNVKTCRHPGAWQIGSKAWILVLLVLVHGEVAQDARAVDAGETPCSPAHRHRVPDEG